MAKTLEDTLLEISQANEHFNAGRKPAAKGALTKAINSGEYQADHLARIINRRGFFDRLTGQLSSAIDHYNTALDTPGLTDDWAALTLVNRADANRLRGDAYQRDARVDLSLALRIAPEASYAQGKVNCETGLFFENSDPERAYDHLMAAANYCRELGGFDAQRQDDAALYARTVSILSRVALRVSEPAGTEELIEILEENLDYTLKTRGHHDQCQAYTDLGAVLLLTASGEEREKRRVMERARDTYLDARSVLPSIGNEREVNANNLHLARVHFALGENEEGIRYLGMFHQGLDEGANLEGDLAYWRDAQNGPFHGVLAYLEATPLGSNLQYERLDELKAAVGVTASSE